MHSHRRTAFPRTENRQDVFTGGRIVCTRTDTQNAHLTASTHTHTAPVQTGASTHTDWSKHSRLELGVEVEERLGQCLGTVVADAVEADVENLEVVVVAQQLRQLHGAVARQPVTADTCKNADTISMAIADINYAGLLPFLRFLRYVRQLSTNMFCTI